MAPAKLKRCGWGGIWKRRPSHCTTLSLLTDAFVMEAADVVEVFGSGTPSLFRFARRTTEAAVVVGQKAAQDLVGGVQIGGTGQTQLAGEAILKGAPETFDAAFGLRTLGGDVGDAELLQSAAELRGLAATGELFFHGPVIVVANEDAVAIAVETEGDAEAAQQAAEQAKIAARIFGGEEFGDQNFAGGVVEEAEQGKLRAAIFAASDAGWRRAATFRLRERAAGGAGDGWERVVCGASRSRPSATDGGGSRDPSEKPSFSTSFSHR